MAATQKAKLHLSVQITEFDQDTGKSQIVDILDKAPFSRIFREGTSDGQIDIVHATALSLAGSGSTTIDLRGTLTDLAGDTITAAELVAVAVVNTTVGSAKADSIIAWGPNSSNGCTAFFGDASDRRHVLSGRAADDPGIDIAYSGWGVDLPVGAGNGDTYEVSNTDTVNAATGWFLVIGRSA